MTRVIPINFVVVVVVVVVFSMIHLQLLLSPGFQLSE